MKVNCPYCDMFAVLTDSAEVYGKSFGMIWICRPCDAYVGVHKNSKKHAPLGRLANAELRRWKQRAHIAFDPFWKGKALTRLDAYKWLAARLGIRLSDCHIGMFDIFLCQKTVIVCKKL